MKKRLLSVALLMGTSFVANAQVGVGTATPNKSAELTVVASNRGILIPNVALTSATDKTTITNGNVQSLMVYATETSKTKDITPGYYYWDINKWVRLTADKDIAQIVVNNFQEILNLDNSKVENLIKNIINKTEGNVVYEGDKLYYINKEGKKEEIKDKLTSIAYDDATGDYIYYNENAVDRNGKIIGDGVRIKVKETVINKFGDIINNKTVQEHITNYLDGTHVGGNVYYDGDKLTYVTKEGDTKEVSINEVITANESKTAIITVDKKQYYVSEEYLAANKGIVPTTVDAKKLPKGIYAIDVVGGVVNNFEEIVNNGPITVDGNTYPTINDYITHLTETTGGFTKIVYDQTTGDVIFQEWDAS
ncbi:V-type ATP synthase subunit E family protein, partial [Myroides injenensis]